MWVLSSRRPPSLPARLFQALRAWVLAHVCSWFVASLHAQQDVALRLRSHLARFDALCRNTRPAPPIRVLIYGQSITARPWTTEAFRPLVAAHPSRSWVITNRCIGGLSAPYLLRTAEADLFTFDPDLVVFHAYGDADAYARLVAEIRRRTTADLLLLNDHYALWDASIFPALGDWSGRALPGLALAHQACMVDVRTPWRDYLVGSNLPLQSLLSDHVHPNLAGEAILQEALTQCLLVPPVRPLPDPFQDDRVATLDIPPEAEASGSWGVPFTGNRVMALAGPGLARFRINGVPPSSLVEARVHGRAAAWPGTWKPFLLQVRHEAALAEETWALRIEAVDGPRHVRFSVAGSITGPDGSGSSTTRFRSTSGRVVIEPSDWYWDGLALALQPGISLGWSTIGRAANSINLPAGSPDTWVPVVAGLPAGRHQLNLQQTPRSPAIRRLMVYSPPGPRNATARPIVSRGGVSSIQVTDPGYRYPSTPAVSVEGSIEPPAIALASASNGVVTDIRVVRTGSGYDAGARVILDPPSLPPRTAAAGCSIGDGYVLDSWVIDGGSGYFSPPRVVLVGGGGHRAEAMARIQDGAVVGIDITDPGEGYSHPPIVQVDPPGPPPPLRIELLASAVRLRLAAPSPWRIQGSTNLVEWTDLGVFDQPGQPFLQWDAPKDSPPRFYRLGPP